MSEMISQECHTIQHPIIPKVNIINIQYSLFSTQHSLCVRKLHIAVPQGSYIGPCLFSNCTWRGVIHIHKIVYSIGIGSISGWDGVTSYTWFAPIYSLCVQKLHIAVPQGSYIGPCLFSNCTWNTFTKLCIP